MADLIVQPSLQLKETDILTVDMLNLMATPVVSLAVETPVTDENFFRNGNNYSSFWTTPAGMTCPVNTETQNSNYWYVNPHGAAVTCKRSTDVPDLYSLWSLEIDGAVGVTDCSVGQQINGDLSATLRRPCTFSGYIENNSGALLNPKLEIWTANSFNLFSACTLQTTVNLQSVANGSWAYDTVTVDLSTITNVANGLFLKVRIPSGALSQPTYRINFARLKFQLGEVATNFVDDPSLFIQTPSIDATMLQDGCIARPTLFMPNVIPTAAYQAKSVNNAALADGAVDSRVLASGAVTGNLGYTPVNQAGDNMAAAAHLGFTTDTAVVATGWQNASVKLNCSTGNANNTGYFPAISFNRPSVFSRAMGLSTTGRFQTIDHTGKIGYMLDSVTGVDTASYQDASVTYAKLATSLINYICPVGMIMLIASPNVQSGWLVCDGSEISRLAPYDKLFAAIGVYWGAGNGNNTFNIPDLRGRVPIGYVNKPVTGITARAWGERAGEETHKLTIAELASHDHTLTDPKHTHTLHNDPHSHPYINPTGALNAAVGSGMYSASGSANTTAAQLNMWADAVATGITMAKTGSDTPHNNMPPYAVLYYIIKY